MNTDITPVLAAGVSKREACAWAMFDFANSGYTTVVITAVFNTYFVSVVAGNAPWATLAWTATLALSYLLLIVAGPLLGAWADARAAKKRLLAMSTVGCVVFTAALSLAGPGDVALAVVFLVLSNVCFGAGENLIAAFLPELADEHGAGRLSGWGWGLGYLGGILSLGLCFAYLDRATAAGATMAAAVPGTLLITAALFALASLPTFLWLKERAVAQGDTGTASRPLATAWARLGRTLRHLGDYPDLRRFLLCLSFSQAGVAAVITLAAIYAQQAMGFSTRDTLLLILVVNLTAALGAAVFGHVQDRIGHVRAIAATLAGWLVMVALAWQAEGVALFWAAANLAGLCLGSSQASGRAFVSALTPPSRQGEFFGLWGLANRLAAIAGPLSYGLATWLSGGNHRLAILTTGAYFVVGLLLLAGIDAERGRRAAAPEGAPR
jgi:UMF1 family MFS transporter